MGSCASTGSRTDGYSPDSTDRGVVAPAPTSRKESPEANLLEVETPVTSDDMNAHSIHSPRLPTVGPSSQDTGKPSRGDPEGLGGRQASTTSVSSDRLHRSGSLLSTSSAGTLFPSTDFGQFMPDCDSVIVLASSSSDSDEVNDDGQGFHNPWRRSSMNEEDITRKSSAVAREMATYYDDFVKRYGVAKQNPELLAQRPTVLDLIRMRKGSTTGAGGSDTALRAGGSASRTSQDRGGGSGQFSGGFYQNTFGADSQQELPPLEKKHHHSTRGSGSTRATRRKRQPRVYDPVDSQLYVQELHAYCRERMRGGKIVVDTDGEMRRLYPTQGWHQLKHKTLCPADRSGAQEGSTVLPSLQRQGGMGTSSTSAAPRAQSQGSKVPGLTFTNSMVRSTLNLTTDEVYRQSAPATSSERDHRASRREPEDHLKFPPVGSPATGAATLRTPLGPASQARDTAALTKDNKVKGSIGAPHPPTSPKPPVGSSTRAPDRRPSANLSRPRPPSPILIKRSSFSRNLSGPSSFANSPTAYGASGSPAGAEDAADDSRRRLSSAQRRRVSFTEGTKDFHIPKREVDLDEEYIVTPTPPSAGVERYNGNDLLSLPDAAVLQQQLGLLKGKMRNGTT